MWRRAGRNVFPCSPSNGTARTCGTCTTQPRPHVSRFLLSGVLPAQMQQELTEVAQGLDPIGLLHQLEQLQQAVFRCAVGCAPVSSPVPSASIRVFSVDDCTVGKLPEERSASDPRAGLQTLSREQERRKRILG